LKDRVKKELKHNGYDEAKDIIFVNDAQEYAFEHTKNYYIDKFTTPAAVRGGTIENYITDKNELKDLSAFFYWGAWVCTTVRPGTDFSYTHNWPYDPGSGNTPTSPVILWSVLGLLAFVLMCGIVLYYIGHYNQIAGKFFKPATRDLFNEERVSKFRPVAIQKSHLQILFCGYSFILFTGFQWLDYHK
jgi:nitric oxide reductase subunit B